MKIYKIASGMIRLYQGQSVHNQNSQYYSTDKEWARQFTQSGQDHEIKTITINKRNIYVKNPLPHATSDVEFDQALAEAKEQGFNAFMLDEGVNEPNSVYIFGEIAKPMSQLDYQKRYDRTNKNLQETLWH